MWWEPATGKEKSQDKPSLLKAENVVIDQSDNKILKKVDFKSRRSVNGGSSGGRSSVKSNMTCHKCGKKGHIQRDCRSNLNGSGENPPKNS